MNRLHTLTVRSTTLALGIITTLSMISACGEDGGSPGPGGAAATGVAIVSSDFKSASVSLMDFDATTLTRDACLTSGTTSPQLTSALAGDVALPSQPQPNGELVVIDRTNATLTWLDPKTCTVKRQLNVGGGFPANPHDVAAVSATKAYVTRYGVNPANAAEGSDLAIIDPLQGTITGRIDLSPFAVDDGSGKPALTRPDRAVTVGGKVYVVLNNLSADFKRAGAGRVLVVDPSTDKVTGTIDLPTLKNCGGLTAFPSGRGLAVSCGGLFGDPKQIETSGIVSVDLSVSPAVIKTTVMAMGFGRPVSFSDLAALDDVQGFVVVPGNFMAMPPDQVWAFGFDSSAPRMVFSGTGAFTLGGLLVDAAHKRLYLGDGAEKAPRLHIFDVSTATVSTPTTSIASSAAGLPPRAVALY